MLHFSVQSRTDFQDGPDSAHGSHPLCVCLHLEMNDKLWSVVHSHASSLQQTWVTDHFVSD